MCGICGVAGAAPINEPVLRRMNDLLFHRGPDGAGLHIGEQIGLAMRRLAIIDVAGSDQPLYNENRTIALVFNGEIFNYRDLRRTLDSDGHRFRSAGDGETIVHTYEQYGLDMPRHLRGQFAGALWDANERRLLLFRDRFGQTPLYYWHDERQIIFASEIKALLVHPDVPRQSALDDPQNLGIYLSYGYVPAPQTAFAGICALQPGQILTWQDGDLRTHSYWQAPPLNPTKTGALPTEDIERVREAVREAVRLRLIADVPLGAFLSGGLDSSLIVALMQEQATMPVQTFSMGFKGDASFDETGYAQQVADFLGTQHTAFRVDPQALDLLPGLVWHHDQPFADSSAIPTYLVSQLTRQSVTVALTGDGGDELFAGYERFYALALVQRLGMIPRPLWRIAQQGLGWLPEGTAYDNIVKRLARFVRGAGLPPQLAYFDWVRIANADHLAALLHLRDVGGEHYQQVRRAAAYRPGSVVDALDANWQTYLPDDLLIKTDRCSMAASLEARAPFLDHELAAVAAALPLDAKLRGRTTKHILKEAARGLLPDAIIDRPKHGFGVPLGAWLREDDSMVREILLDSSTLQRGLFDSHAVTQLLDEHLSGQWDHNRLIWTLLTLEVWYRRFIDSFDPSIAPALHGQASVTAS